MKETTIFEKVSAKDKLPSQLDQGIEIIWIHKDGYIIVSSPNLMSLPNEELQKAEVYTHWLRERQAIVLSKDQLLELLNDYQIFYKVNEHDFDRGKSENLNQQFIEGLTETK